MSGRTVLSPLNLLVTAQSGVSSRTMTASRGLSDTAMLESPLVVLASRTVP